MRAFSTLLALANYALPSASNSCKHDGDADNTVRMIVSRDKNSVAV